MGQPGYHCHTAGSCRGLRHLQRCHQQASPIRRLRWIHTLTRPSRSGHRAAVLPRSRLQPVSHALPLWQRVQKRKNMLGKPIPLRGSTPIELPPVPLTSSIFPLCNSLRPSGPASFQRWPPPHHAAAGLGHATSPILPRAADCPPRRCPEAVAAAGVVIASS